MAIEAAGKSPRRGEKPIKGEEEGEKGGSSDEGDKGCINISKLAGQVRRCPLWLEFTDNI